MRNFALIATTRKGGDKLLAGPGVRADKQIETYKSLAREPVNDEIASVCLYELVPAKRAIAFITEAEAKAKAEAEAKAKPTVHNPKSKTSKSVIP